MSLLNGRKFTDMIRVWEIKSTCPGYLVIAADIKVPKRPSRDVVGICEDSLKEVYGCFIMISN